MSYDSTINDALLDQQVSYDPDAELNALNLPDDGMHIATLEVGRDGVQVKQTKKSGAFIQAHVMARIQEPGASYDKAVAFDRPSSVILTNGTSFLHSMLKAGGDPAPSSTSLRDLQAQTKQFLAGKPQVKVRTRWEGSVIKGVENGKKFYEVVLKGQRSFPQNPDGTYNPRFTYNGQEGVAQVSITDYQPAEAGQANGAY